MLTPTDTENLTTLYGTAHILVETLEKMFDEKGQPKSDITKRQIDELKDLSRETACRANAILSVYDGIRKP